MTVEDQAVPAEDQVAPPESEEQAGSESGESAPQPTEREKDLERRLRKQGQQLADLARTNQQLSGDLTRINSTVTTLTEHLTSQQREADERRQRETQAYLDSLPEPQRLKEEVRLANERVSRLENTLRTRNDATPRTSDVSPSQPQRADETPQEYFRRRGNEIIAQTAATFGVTITRDHLETLDESDWDDEQSFTRAVNRLAVRIESGDDIVADKKKAPAKAETPAEMEARITENVKKSLGVSSPASPKASGNSGRRGAPTVEEIHETVSTYDSRKGPKQNLEKLRQQRAQLG